jgi:hypothetical protein
MTNPAHPPETATPAPKRTLADFLPGDKYSQYLLTGRNEMFAVCRGLADHVSLISMIFNGGHDMVLTTLISWGENGLLLDFGASEEMNQAALKADKLFLLRATGQGRDSVHPARGQARRGRRPPNLPCPAAGEHSAAAAPGVFPPADADRQPPALQDALPRRQWRAA